MNFVTLVGRLTKDVELNEKTEERAFETSVITLAVQQPFKNAEGLYDTNFVPIHLIGAVAKNTAEYVKKGDIIGIKGRIQCLNGDLQIIAEKVSFLSSSSNVVNKEEGEE